MKILTIMGTRPELIRLSLIIKKLDNLVNHVLIYTNQNYDYNLSTVFFDELEIRKPDYRFDFNFDSYVDFLSKGIIEFNKILEYEKPDKILVLGDTNSGLLTFIANRKNIPIYHMEAGNRCYDNRVPEELNRKLIDNISTYNLPYTENSKENLLNEGFHKNYVFKTGNPIHEVLIHYNKKINSSEIIEKFKLKLGEYVLSTFHRSENTDNENVLKNIVLAVNEISKFKKVILPLHPRTKNKIDSSNIKLNDNIIVINPLGFFDFVKLEMNAYCVISDSGTVQEECCIFGVPSLTIRESTERQETIECGSNILCGTNSDNIIRSFKLINRNTWDIPSDYKNLYVSDIIINILISK